MRVHQYWRVRVNVEGCGCVKEDCQVNAQDLEELVVSDDQWEKAELKFEDLSQREVVLFQLKACNSF
jgi:hypothetical protein